MHKFPLVTRSIHSHSSLRFMNEMLSGDTMGGGGGGMKERPKTQLDKIEIFKCSPCLEFHTSHITSVTLKPSILNFLYRGCGDFLHNQSCISCDHGPIISKSLDKHFFP
jgi:hypothetical protein